MAHGGHSNLALALATFLSLFACGQSAERDGEPGGAGGSTASSGSGSTGAGQGGSGGSAGSAGSSGGAEGAGVGGAGGSPSNVGGTAGTMGGSAGSAGSSGDCNCAAGDLQCAIQCASSGGGSSDCTSDKQCSGGTCVELSPGGYRVCASGPAEATSCANQEPAPFPDECCQSSECAEGLCVTGSGPVFCGGPAVQPYNRCASDECASSADCADLDHGVCFPAGAYGYPVATCRAGSCRVDSDCKEEPDGRCQLILDECCGTPSLVCVYADGCTTVSDCPQGSQSCRIEDGRGVCSPDLAICPA